MDKYKATLVQLRKERKELITKRDLLKLKVQEVQAAYVEVGESLSAKLQEISHTLQERSDVFNKAKRQKRSDAGYEEDV